MRRHAAWPRRLLFVCGGVRGSAFKVYVKSVEGCELGFRGVLGLRVRSAFRDCLPPRCFVCRVLFVVSDACGSFVVLGFLGFCWTLLGELR